MSKDINSESIEQQKKRYSSKFHPNRLSAIILFLITLTIIYFITKKTEVHPNIKQKPKISIDSLMTLVKINKYFDNNKYEVFYEKQDSSIKIVASIYNNEKDLNYDISKFENLYKLYTIEEIESVCLCYRIDGELNCFKID